jgi:hypothetical protein
MTGAIAVVALSDPLLGATLERSLYLGGVPSEALLVCSVLGEASSGEVHRNWDVVHGSWGIRGVESWLSLVIESLWRSVIELLQGSEDRGVCARPHCSKELSGFDYHNGFVLQVLVAGGDLLDYSFHHVWRRFQSFEEVVHCLPASYRVCYRLGMWENCLSWATVVTVHPSGAATHTTPASSTTRASVMALVAGPL